MAALSGITASFTQSRRMKTEPIGARICHSVTKIKVMSDDRRLFIPRCSVSSEVSVNMESKRMSLSTLQLLKTSVADRYTKEKSSIAVIGLNYHTAPLDIREKLSIPVEFLSEAINELCSMNHIEEAAVLSTCNRMEIYVVALSQHRGVKEATDWMSKASGVPFSEICQHRFLLYGKDAIKHLFEVSSGLDSIVLGEGQILSQVKQVVKSGEAVPGFGRKISGLFKNAITVGKRVRTETNKSTGSVSVSSAAVDLVLTKIPESSYANLRVLVVGAGKMGKLVIRHMISKGCKSMVVVNRTEERAASICEEMKGAEITFRPLPELLDSAAEADVIFTSTASEIPLLLKEHVERFPPVRNGNKAGGERLFIDISVPRNVESGVSDLENVCVYTVDDLGEVAEANVEDRLKKLNEAQEIIIEEVVKFENWKNTLETVPTIKKLRAYAERIRASELEKCLSKMGDGTTKKEKEAVYDLSMGVMNKLIHGPTQHLRCDGNEKRTMSEILENMHALNRVFGLDTDMSVLEEKIRAKMGQVKT